jgi:uncharacterized membrane protein
MAHRLSRRITASEARHSGEIRLCVEAALPLSYLWRLGNETSVRVLARERAVSWFGRLGVWDTQDNNGVLIYLLLAERSIELVADRGLSARVDQARWQAMVDRLAGRLHQGAFEDGLTQALEEVSALLVEFFPAQAGGPNPNELPDLVVRA